MFRPCPEDVTVHGDKQKERVARALAGPQETVLPLRKVNETHKEVREKTNRKPSQLPSCAWCHPKEPSAKVKAWPEFLWSEVRARGLRSGHTEIPSAVPQGGPRVEGGDQVFLSNALSSLIITKVTAINPRALRVTLCYLAALPKAKRNTLET